MKSQIAFEDVKILSVKLFDISNDSVKDLIQMKNILWRIFLIFCDIIKIDIIEIFLPQIS